MDADGRPTPEAWLSERLGEPFRIEPASSDASFRRYFRVHRAASPTRILMDAPPGHEDCRPYVAVARMLREAGVHAPAVVETDTGNGYLLLEDLGSVTYLSVKDDAGRVDAMYDDALDALCAMQRIEPPAHALPDYDEALLRFELSLFSEWFVGRHLGIAVPPSLEAVEDLLVENALAQPRVFVHRDYHSRNLMWLERDNPGVLDFQDAVYGPVSYDLVSLLRDCYVSWPDGRVDGWIRSYRRRAGEAGIDCADAATFQRWFDLMGVQRQLKATGIFARLYHRDGKPGYLADIPRTLGYTRSACARYEALGGFGAWLADTVWPALQVA